MTRGRLVLPLQRRLHTSLLDVSVPGDTDGWRCCLLLPPFSRGFFCYSHYVRVYTIWLYVYVY